MQLPDSVSAAVTPTTSAVTTTPSQPPSTKRTLAGGRKERTLAKIAPAGGLIALNTSQLSPAAQAVQTISINGVQVQGVPVTITNTGGESQHGTPLLRHPQASLWLNSPPPRCWPGQQHLTVQTMQGSGLQLATTAGQPTLQVDQTLTLELPSQPGEKKRRMACTCPNCKDADKR